MRIVFSGTPEVAVPSLAALVAAGHDVAAVITREDAPLGRRRVLTPSPVAAWAEANGLEVIRANRLGDDVTRRVEELGVELGVIVAYGGLVREPLLSTPERGWINLHFSLLPAWRGAAPLQRSLIAGDEEIGATVFQLVPELDAGDVWHRSSMPTPPEGTAGELLGVLAESGAEALVSTLALMREGEARPTPQEGEVSLAPKLALEDGRLDWAAPAGAVYARYRGVTPEPGAFTTIGGARLKIPELRPVDDAVEALAPGEFRLEGRRVLVGTATEPVELVHVQPAGKQAMDAAAWWRGLRDTAAVRADTADGAEGSTDTAPGADERRAR